MNDKGRRRYLSYSLDFDTRGSLLSTEPTSEWNDVSVANHQQAQINVRKSLAIEYGEHCHTEKVNNFIDLGDKSFSIIGYHNALNAQARSAFVIGSYYPALTAACALGERLLNHLVLDLRYDFIASTSFEEVKDQKSFNNWKTMIDLLSSWDVLLDDARENFLKLIPLRHKSLHFNSKMTHDTLRQDALKALCLLQDIIGRQFGSFGNQPWMIEGTKGHCFIKKSYEDHPFVKRYYLPQCPLVGILFAIKFDPAMRVEYYDKSDYGNEGIDDEEFRESFNNRQHDLIVKPGDQGLISWKTAG